MVDSERTLTDVSPITPHNEKSSLVESNLDNGKPYVVKSLADPTSYYPDEKICMPMEDQRPAVPPVPLPPQYASDDLPKRPLPVPFWRRHICWIVCIFTLMAIFIAVLGTFIVRCRSTRSEIIRVVPNNTLHSVASSGIMLLDNKTWNMQVFSQQASGDISVQMSLDGKSFQPPENVSLSIQPRSGSPLSAVTELDQRTGVIMMTLFYISGDSNITFSSINCSPQTTKCNTITNNVLPTKIPVSNATGLSVVNVRNAQDWRVYYYDQLGFLSELEGNSSSFSLGERIGGQALIGSSLAAVNTNETTNNIHIFYSDMLTKALFTIEFQNDWTSPTPVSDAPVGSWNPFSGISSSYSPSTDELHVYYTGIDQGIYEFLGKGSATWTTKFGSQPGRNHLWAPADYVSADITTVGWLDQARFFQSTQGRLAMGKLNGTVWSEEFVDQLVV